MAGQPAQAVVHDQSSETAGAQQSPRGRRRPIQWVVIALVLAAVWPLLWAGGQGTADVLLGAGDDGPSRVFIESEIPDLAPLVSAGHDGQQFYVIARHPFDPQAGADDLDTPSYRYRRILFPLLGGLLAPGGGRAVIVSFFVLSMIGVALGALALRSLPGAPRWLPIAMAVSPAVITSLTLSLSDAFGSGLALASIALATKRRWAWAVGMAVLAALTRETFLIVALGIALSPGMPRPWRLASLALPGAAVGGWMLWVSQQLGTSPLDGGSDQLAIPLSGYLSGSTDTQTFVMSLGAALLLLVGAWRCSRIAPHIAVVLLLQVVLLVCVSDLVAFNWVNCVRTAAPLLPLGVWALVARPGSEDDQQTSLDGHRLDDTGGRLMAGR